MSKSLLEQLPGIVAAGKRQAAQILEQLEGRNRVSLQTRELVIPSKDRDGFNFWGNEGDDAAEARNRPVIGLVTMLPFCFHRALAGITPTIFLPSPRLRHPSGGHARTVARQ